MPDETNSTAQPNTAELESPRPQGMDESPSETRAEQPQDAAAAAPPQTKDDGTSKEQVESGPKITTKGFATEKPVLVRPPPSTSTYLITLDNRAGGAIKIEKLNEETGERRELSQQEYARIYPSLRPRLAAASRTTPAAARMLAAGFSGTASASPEIAALTEAYYRGVADYIKAITGW